MMEPTKHHKSYGSRFAKVEANPDCCAKLISNGVLSSSQCKNKRHPDTLDGAFCKVHCPDRRKAKREKKYAEWLAESAARRAKEDAAARRDDLKAEAVALLHGILAGEMTPVDPACRDWLAKWEAQFLAGDE